MSDGNFLCKRREKKEAQDEKRAKYFAEWQNCSFHTEVEVLTSITTTSLETLLKNEDFTKNVTRCEKPDPRRKNYLE